MLSHGVIISMDGDAETHDQVRGSDGFSRVLRTLAVLADNP